MTHMATRRPWQDDMAWGRQYLFHMKAICGAYLMTEPPWEEDAHHNTDLIFLTTPSDVRIACRVRRPQYLYQYPDEFTIRSERGSGVDTEMGKLLAGWGDYLLYGFADPSAQRPRLKAWVLADLAVFRDWYSAVVDLTGVAPGDLRRNGDGSSNFVAFVIDDLPAHFVIARQWADGERMP